MATDADDGLKELKGAAQTTWGSCLTYEDGKGIMSICQIRHGRIRQWSSSYEKTRYFLRSLSIACRSGAGESRGV